MTSHDEPIRTYYALGPTQYPVMSRIELRQATYNSGAFPEFILEMHLARSPGCDLEHVRMRFENVRQFRLLQPQWSVFQVEPFDIKSIRDSQWEGINYEVKERELLSFICRMFTVTLVKSAEKLPCGEEKIPEEKLPEEKKVPGETKVPGTID